MKNNELFLQHWYIRMSWKYPGGKMQLICDKSDVARHLFCTFVSELSSAAVPTWANGCGDTTTPVPNSSLYVSVASAPEGENPNKRHRQTFLHPLSIHKHLRNKQSSIQWQSVQRARAEKTRSHPANRKFKSISRQKNWLPTEVLHNQKFWIITSSILLLGNNQCDQTFFGQVKYRDLLNKQLKKVAILAIFTNKFSKFSRSRLKSQKLR